MKNPRLVISLTKPAREKLDKIAEDLGLKSTQYVKMLIVEKIRESKEKK